jgi:undecaprenyl-diphosphatase
MGYLEAIILGVIQGVTEFLPVSSSGHLIIARAFLGEASPDDLAIDAILQLATTLAIVVYFFRDFLNIATSFLNKKNESSENMKSRKLGKVILIATVPAVFFGLLLEDSMETIFRSTTLVALSLMAGSVLMVIAEKMYSGKSSLSMKNGFVVGLFQTLALVPGISRSGSTISGGMIVGLSRENATRLSFLLATPILAGSGLKKLFELLSSSDFALYGPLIAGSVASFAVGLVAIKFLLRFLRTNNLYPFIFYRVLLALLVLAFF